MTLRTWFALPALAVAVALAAAAPTRLGPAAIAPAEAAASVPDLQDLVGGRATAGEAQFRARGFVVAKMRGLTIHWWQRESQRCVRSVTAQGLYRSIMPVGAAQCGM